MNSFPWDSVITEMGEDGLPVYDRPSTASDLQGIFSHFFTNGVATDVDGGFQVYAGSGMTATVKTGWCCISGTFGLQDEELSVQLDGPDASNGRVDTIVLRWNKNVSARSISVAVVKGTPSASPMRPELTRTASVYELGIADVLVSAGATSLTQESITDTRLDTTRCGVMTPFAEIDTTGIYEQLKDQVDRNIEVIQAAVDNTLWDVIYPVGSVYISYSSTSPASLFGGTWTAITGVFPYFNAGTGTGGSNTHTLTVEEMPSHYHGQVVTSDAAPGNSSRIDFSRDGQGASYTQGAVTNSTGGGQAHNNMPAYQEFYAWRRTA